MMKALVLTLAATLLAAEPAAAADGHSWRIGDDSIHLYYSDLDLNTAQGRQRMLVRVERAARRLCDLPLKVDGDACFAATMSGAARAPGGAALTLALAERGRLRTAGR